MILTTEFSLRIPARVVVNTRGFSHVNTPALSQTLAFMSEPITAADWEEGLNNVPLPRNEKTQGGNFVVLLTQEKQEKSQDQKPDPQLSSAIQESLLLSPLYRNLEDKMLRTSVAGSQFPQASSYLNNK